MIVRLIHFVIIDRLVCYLLALSKPFQSNHSSHQVDQINSDFSGRLLAVPLSRRWHTYCNWELIVSGSLVALQLSSCCKPRGCLHLHALTAITRWKKQLTFWSHIANKVNTTMHLWCVIFFGYIITAPESLQLFHWTTFTIPCGWLDSWITRN